MFAHTKLAIVIAPNILLKLERLGEVVSFKPQETIFSVGDKADYLYINIKGNIYLHLKHRDAWIGPGDILGEIGYILDTSRTTSASAGDAGCTVWRTHRKLLLDDSFAEYAIFITHLLIGLAPHINLRYLTVTTKQQIDPTLGETHCDSDHPAIQKITQYLKSKDDWESAINVWQFVRNIPYRFGFWNVKASQTLELGFGMCTTKANLQVALLRALGIKAQFGECKVAAKYLIPFLPAAYRNMITKNIKHYFAIVTLDGKPYRADASFTREALQILANAHPQYTPLIYERFRRKQEFAIDKEDTHKVFDDLSHVMNKRPFYDADNAEAMNLYLDSYQGPVILMPHWVNSTQYLLSHNPNAARMKALAGIISDLTKLHNAIEAREKKMSYIVH